MTVRSLSHQAPFVVLTSALILSAILWINLSPFPFLQDFTDWIYQGYIVSHLLQADGAMATKFSIVSYPVPNTACQMLMGILGLGFSPILSAKLFLDLYVIFASSIGYLIARRSKNPGAVLFLFLFLFVFNSPFFGGYMNYQIALLGMSLYLYLVVLNTNRSPLFHMSFSILIFFAHFSIYLLFVTFYVATYIAPLAGRPLHRTLSLAGRSALILVPSLGLALWYGVARLVGLGPDLPLVRIADKVVDGSILQFAAYKAYTLTKLGPFHVFELPGGKPFVPHIEYLYWCGVALNFLFALGLCAYLYRALRSRIPARGVDVPPLPANILIVLLAMGVLFALTPQFFFGVVNIGERFLLSAMLLVFIVSPPKGMPLGVLSISAALCLPVTLMFFVQYQQPEPEAGAAWSARYFTHRPYQFGDLATFLANPDPATAPDLSFPTGFLFQKANR